MSLNCNYLYLISVVFFRNLFDIYVVCYVATLISYDIITPCVKVVLLEVSNLSFFYEF